MKNFYALFVIILASSCSPNSIESVGGESTPLPPYYITIGEGERWESSSEYKGGGQYAVEFKIGYGDGTDGANPNYDPDACLMCDLWDWATSDGEDAQEKQDESQSEELEETSDSYVEFSPPESPGEAPRIINGSISPRIDPERSSELGEVSEALKNDLEKNPEILKKRDILQNEAAKTKEHFNRRFGQGIEGSHSKDMKQLEALTKQAIESHNRDANQVLQEVLLEESDWNDAVKVDALADRESLGGETVFLTTNASLDGKKVRAVSQRIRSAREAFAQGASTSFGNRVSSQILEYADRSVSAADRYYASGNSEKGDRALEIAVALADIALGFIPGVGWAKDIYEAVSGQSLVSSEPLDDFSRITAIIGAATFGVGSKIGSAADSLEVLASIGKAAAKDADKFDEAIETVAAIEKTWSLKAYEHVIVGEKAVVNGEVKLTGGLHTEAGLNRFIEENKTLGKNYEIKHVESFERKNLNETEILVQDLPNGVTRVQLPRTAFKNGATADRAATKSEGKTINQVKTLWPKNYSADDIRAATDKVPGRPPGSGPGSSEGIVNGVVIKKHFDKDGKVVTSYPMWNQ